MSSLAKMKLQLDELANQKRECELVGANANRFLKYSLWVMGAGILLIPLYGVGILILLVSGIVAIVNLVRRTKSQDKIEQLEDQIHKLEISMP